jgi:GH15 family glucan-1,4-alpha-glucosidase
MNMPNLYRQSIDILLSHQNPSGAYIASPNFPSYKYAWLRDGSFCAYALDQAGEYNSVDLFHNWVFKVLDTYQYKLNRCIAEISRGRRLPDKDCLHSRFQLDGLEVPGNWGHHQLDSLGTWIWVYCRREKRSKAEISSQKIKLIMLARDYLISSWRFPCSDCWEENEDRMHSHSLGAVYAGLKSLGEWFQDPVALAAADEIQTFILEKCVINGHLTKSIGIPDIDASLLSLAVPYQVFELNDPIFRKTYQRIVDELVEPEGGVHRYLSDTYYGGGEWLLLAAWLGWVAYEMGDVNLARRQLNWIEQHATPGGELAEQVSEHLLAPGFMDRWIERWGQPAVPLLWSHAQYLILQQRLEGTNAVN